MGGVVGRVTTPISNTSRMIAVWLINHHIFGSIRNAGDAAHIAKSLEAIHLTEEFPPENWRYSYSPIPIQMTDVIHDS